jgi:hypothetical protein
MGNFAFAVGTAADIAASLTSWSPNQALDTMVLKDLANILKPKRDVCYQGDSHPFGLSDRRLRQAYELELFPVGKSGV